MRAPRIVAFAVVAIVVTVAVALLAQPRRLGNAPVVVELFTSQGCSSCPPADDLLRRIAADPELRARVIPLAFHVDYWNHLGWRDPFSQAAWSQRQGDYVRAMRLSGAYTPQIVVNGSRQMVGSATGVVYEAIEQESSRAPVGRITLRRDGANVVIRAESPRGGVDVMLVVFEDGAVTKVAKGENRGRTLADDRIVRRLERVATLDGHGVVEERVPLTLGPREGVAAFLQERATKRIVAAASN
jgi:hypothetical protein